MNHLAIYLLRVTVTMNSCEWVVWAWLCGLCYLPPNTTGFKSALLDLHSNSFPHFTLHLSGAHLPHIIFIPFHQISHRTSLMDLECTLWSNQTYT